MKHINLNVLIEQVLDALKRSGMQAKQLKDYKYCGIYPIRQYFNSKGLNVYSRQVADEFILQSRIEYEQKRISQWKWGTLRRSAELLDKYHTEGTVILPPLPQWNVLHNPLRQEPSPQQLSEKDNLFVLIHQTKQELIKFGYLEKTIKNYVYDGFDAIYRYCTGHNVTRYDKDTIDSFVAQARAKYESHTMCRSVYQNIRKVATLLDEYHETGQLQLRTLPAWGLRMPNAYYADTLELFCNKQSGVFAPGTVAFTRSPIRNFLFELEDTGYTDFCEVTLSVVSECVSKIAQRYTGGIQSMLFAIRSFLLFLYQNGMILTDLSIAIPEMAPQKRVTHSGFSSDEVDRLLHCPDRNATIGKRDYAIMMTAIQTGLRAVDIVNLKRQDIDWRNLEIRIVQQKTGQPLNLPLEPETGNAIADYLLTGRPKCNSPFIFLCISRPYRPLANRSASTMVSKYMQQTGVSESPILRRGFHSFRRSFGTNLLESEVPLDLLSEMLGHTDMDSTKPYLAANELGLKSCALGLLPIRKEGDSYEA